MKRPCQLVINGKLEYTDGLDETAFGDQLKTASGQ